MRPRPPEAASVATPPLRRRWPHAPRAAPRLATDGDWALIADWQTGLDGGPERAEAVAAVEADCRRFVADRLADEMAMLESMASVGRRRRTLPAAGRRFAFPAGRTFTQAELVVRVEALPGVRRARWPRGGEWHGSCPVCGGKDRCWVTVAGKLGCRRCPDNGKQAWKLAVGIAA